MDPISQLGWRNGRPTFEGPAEQLMRDVFEVTDGLHADAMSEMAATRHTEGSEFPLNGVRADVASMSQRSHSHRSPAFSVEVDQEGRIACCCLPLSAHTQCGQ
jgi:hypothetical protein